MKSEPMMSLDEIQSIEQKAFKLLDESGAANQFPVPILKAVHHLGYELFKLDPKSKEDHRNFSGAVLYKEKKIYVNSAENVKRHRFTIAHEIGHIVLHHTTEEPGFLDFRLSMVEFKDKKEVEANYFAAEFLMPKEIFKYQWEKTKGNISLLSDFFGLNPSAIGVRAEFLKLFNF